MVTNTRLALATLAVLGAVALTACSSGTAGTVVLEVHASTASVGRATSFPSSVPATGTPAAAPPTTASPTAAPPTVSDDNARELVPALLSATDLAASYRSTTHDAPVSLPCTPSEPPVDERIAHVEKGVADYVGPEQVRVAEQIYVYGSVTEAIRHQQIDEEGLGCASGRLRGLALDIAGPIMLGNRLALTRRPDKAEGWTLANSAVNGELILVRIHAVVIQLSFSAPSTVRPTLDVKHVIEVGIDKVVAAGR